jgi:Cohesin loading factor
LTRKNNAPWEYALRFLHITLSLERASHHDVIVALSHLRAISDLAEKEADKAVFVYCAAIEALAYIYTETADCITSAQDSIARARALQMDRSVQDIHAVWYFVACVDLVCSLLRYEKAEVISQKLDAARAIVEKSPFAKDGELNIPLGGRSSRHIHDFASKVFAKQDDKVILQFHWLPSMEIYALACLLSASTGVLKMATEKRNTKFVHEGLTKLKGMIHRLLTVSLIK